MAIHYWWVLVVLPWSVSLAATLIGGFLVGIIVTVTHQSETMMSPLSEHNYCYYTDQFLSTRDVKTSDFVMEYLWGGMQYQLEHHLFPTMPRYKYPALRPRLQAFAKSVGIEYRMSGSSFCFQCPATNFCCDNLSLFFFALQAFGKSGV
jgi:fatty acid desaturase